MASYYLILPAYNLMLRLLVFAVEPVLGFHRHETRILHVFVHRLLGIFNSLANRPAILEHILESFLAACFNSCRCRPRPDKAVYPRFDGCHHRLFEYLCIILQAFLGGE